VDNVTDEEQLAIQACLDGNAGAFEVLVCRYEAHVKALAWNITGSAEEAMEVSQDTFLQAFKNLDRYDTRKNFKSWLLGITVKRSIDRLRRRNTFTRFFNRYAQEAPMVKEEIKPLEDSPIFNPLLKRLKERERIALSLQVNENFSAKEIGQVLECSESSARVLLFKAKKKLKKELTTLNMAPGKKQFTGGVG
jgi:RNA polymerase sigma-70 factor, ECF subfamily